MKHRHAFTIVELLVVISVIALLLSLVLPTMSRARNVAMRSVCASNYRQLGIGSAAYAGDSKDDVPWLNDGFYGSLGYGGPQTEAGIQTDYLCCFSRDYLNAVWTYNAATNRMIMPKVLVDPGLRNGMYRPNPTGWGTGATATPDLGQWNASYVWGSIGNTTGFGSLLGLYFNNCTPDRSGIGTNGGINARWRLRNDDAAGWGPDDGCGTDRLRFQEFQNPSSEVIFIDLEFQDGGFSTSSATQWSIPHGSGNMPDGINEGYVDGSVRFYAQSQMNAYYVPAAYWAFSNKITPMYLDLNKPQLFNYGGYPPETLWQPTTLNWYGVTTPNVGLYSP